MPTTSSAPTNVERELGRDQRKDEAVNSAPGAMVCAACHPTDADVLAQALRSPGDRLAWLFRGA